MQYNIHYREKDKGIQFIISYKDNLGKWKQKSKQGFKTKREAKLAADIALDELKNNLELSKNLSLEYSELTFQEFKDIYLEHNKLYKSANTIENTKFALAQFENLYEMKLRDINNMHIQVGIDYMVKKGNSARTIETRIGYLKSFFNSAIKEYKIIKENPVTDLKILVEKKAPNKRALNETEFNALVKTLEGTRYHLVVLIAGTCVLRIGEILGLTWDVIDESNNTMTINKQFKMLAPGTFGLGDLKSKNSNRVVPIPPHTMKAIKEYKKCSVRNIDGRLFNFGNNRYFHTIVNRRMQTLGFNISLHELRHTYATKLIANGLDLKTVAKLLGHDIEMTMNTYSHVNDDMMNRATKIINNIF